MEITVAELATATGMAPATIKRILYRIGYQQTDGRWLIDPETAEYIKSRKGKRGRP